MLDPLTLDQLRVLVAVADTGSFSAAARKLGRVQSAISQSVNALETALGTPVFDRTGKVPKLNDAGRVILADARRLITGADTLKARAESINTDVEPELTLAVDAIIPNRVLTHALKGLSEAFPCLSVSLFTEGLGGAEQRLRDGVARLGLYVPIPGTTDEMESEFLMSIPTVPVVAADHPLAKEQGPLSRDILEAQVQLVLTDRTPMTNGLSGGILSRRTWRFADLSTRLDFLLAGFGWCNMPVHLVHEHIEAGRLKALEIPGNPIHAFAVHVVYQRGRPPGRAGRWLIAELRRLLPECTASYNAAEEDMRVAAE